MAGHKFSELEGFLTENNRWQFESWRNGSFQGHQDISLVTFESYKALWSTLCPSDTMMHNIFLQTFHKEEHLYDRSFDMVVGNTIVIDQTFSLPALIGYAREDNTWETLYKGLLLATNSIGQVMAFQFVKSRDIHEGTQLLQDLRARCGSSSNLQLMVYDCCLWRDYLREVFVTSSSTVWLNLDHAIQTVVETIPEENPMRKRFLKKFRLVFRSENDYGAERTLPTPSTVKILENFNGFLASWHSSEHVEDQVMSDHTLNALEELRVHITKGCLSNIPGNVSGVRNEKLHNLLKNSALVGIRFGLEMANALLNTIFYRWNTQKVLPGGMPLPPVWRNEAVSGVLSAATPEPRVPPAQTESNSGDVSMGRQRSQGQLSTKECSGKDAHIWSHALADIYRYVQENHPSVDLQIHWFAECAINCEDVWEFLFKTESSLQDNINAFDLSAIEMQGSSVLSVWDGILAPVSHHANSANLDIPLALRKDPLFTEAASKSSMTLDQIHELLLLASVFLSTIFLAVVPAKICPFVPFVALSSGPKPYVYVAVVPAEDGLFCVKPMKCNNSKKRNAVGFDSDDETTPTKIKMNKGCRCGQSSKNGKPACTNAPDEGAAKRLYKSRCICLQESNGCSQSCKCVNCANPNGKRSIGPLSNVPTKRSKRQETKRPCLRPLRGVDFLEASDDFVPTGLWSTAETLCLYICAGSLDGANEEEDMAGVYIRKLRDMYMSVQRLCMQGHCKRIPLGPKSLCRVRCKYWNIINRRTARRVMAWCSVNAANSPEDVQHVMHRGGMRQDSAKEPVSAMFNAVLPQDPNKDSGSMRYHAAVQDPNKDSSSMRFHAVAQPDSNKDSDPMRYHHVAQPDPNKDLGSMRYHAAVLQDPTKDSDSMRYHAAVSQDLNKDSGSMRYHAVAQPDSNKDSSSMRYHTPIPQDPNKDSSSMRYHTPIPQDLNKDSGSMRYHTPIPQDPNKDSSSMRYHTPIPQDPNKDSSSMRYHTPIPQDPNKDSSSMRYHTPIPQDPNKDSSSMRYHTPIPQDPNKDSSSMRYHTPIPQDPNKDSSSMRYHTPVPQDPNKDSNSMRYHAVAQPDPNKDSSSMRYHAVVQPDPNKDSGSMRYHALAQPETTKDSVPMRYHSAVPPDSSKDHMRYHAVVPQDSNKDSGSMSYLRDSNKDSLRYHAVIPQDSNRDSSSTLYHSVPPTSLAENRVLQDSSKTTGSVTYHSGVRPDSSKESQLVLGPAGSVGDPQRVMYHMPIPHESPMVVEDLTLTSQ